MPPRATSTFAAYSPPPAHVRTVTLYEYTENRSSLIVVSAVALVVIVALATVILIQCLLMARMRKSKVVALHANNEIYSKNVSSDIDMTVAPNEAYAVPAIPPTTMQVAVTRNEAYGVHDAVTRNEAYGVHDAVTRNEAYGVHDAVTRNEAYGVHDAVTRNEAYGVHDKRTAPEDDYELILR